LLEVSLRNLVLALALLLLPLAGAATANSIISCHCFQERAYDPARPQAADPYLLATVQNTFMAAVFDLAKRDLVQAKMGGTSGDRLWVAHYLARGHGVAASTLLAARQRSSSWRGALQAMNLGMPKAGERFAGLLQDDGGEALLAAAAADDILQQRLGIAGSTLERLRFRGAGTAEVIFCAVLAGKSGRSPLDLHEDFTSGRSTWGQMFDALGLQPGAPLENELRRQLYGRAG
jgi:hypothetical protein